MVCMGASSEGGMSGAGEVGEWALFSSGAECGEKEIDVECGREERNMLLGFLRT